VVDDAIATGSRRAIWRFRASKISPSMPGMLISDKTAIKRGEISLASASSPEPAIDRFRRVQPVARHSDDRLLSEPTAAIQLWRREPLLMLRVFGRLPVTDSAMRSRAGVGKASGEETAGGVCAGGGVGLWGFSVDVGPDPPVWNRDDGWVITAALL